MYFIEKIIKVYLKFKTRNIIPIIPESDDIELEDIVTCQHNFMPVDSTGNILACSKCGYVIKKERLKKED